MEIREATAIITIEDTTFCQLKKNLFEHVVFYVMCSFGDFSICLAFLFFPYLFNFTLNIFSRRVYGNEPYS